METNDESVLAESSPGDTASGEGAAARQQRLLRQLIAQQRRRGHEAHIARELHAWDHRAHTGTIEMIQAAIFAIHVGAGVYHLLELVRDLHGIVPEAGKLLHIDEHGTVAALNLDVLQPSRSVRER